MTACQCPAGHAVLVLESTDFREWRCPVHDAMDVQAAREAIEDLQHVNEEIRREDVMPEGGGKR